MTETLIAMVPTYGVYLLFFTVFVACLAVPLPSSMVALTAGSFSALGELSLAVVLSVGFLAYALGDQLAFGIARAFGPRLVDRLKGSDNLAPILSRSEALLQSRGSLAVFLSHTIISPTAPYVTYLSGAGGLSWRAFCLAAVPGAAIWTLGYVLLGYTFASQLEQVAETLSHFIGFVLAGAIAVGCLVLLRSRWRAHQVA